MEEADLSVLLTSVFVSSAAGIVAAVVIRVLNRRYVVALYEYLVEFLRRIYKCFSISRPCQEPKDVPPSQPVAAPSVSQAQTQKKKPVGKSVKSTHSTYVKAHAAPKHRLELTVFKGHGDSITGIAFTSNGRGLASACADRIVRVFRIDNASTRDHQALKLNVPAGCIPAGIVFGEGASKVVVATQDLSGAGLLMFGASEGKAAALAKEQGKLPPPEIKWRKEKIHDKKAVLTCSGARCEYGTGDGSVIVATCSEGTDIKLWSSESGKCLGGVDTNQLKNTMAAVSPDGRFLAAAAFTADVKVWEILYGKDGQVRDVTKVMMLKGHKSAVTWVCFTSDSQRMITASKDGSIRVWNINVRYHLDEDPKCLKTFPIPNEQSYYDMIAVSADDKVLAATMGSTLTFMNAEDGSVLDTVANAHDGHITCLVWAPQPVTTDQGKIPVLATASADKKIKLWRMP